MSRVSSDDQVRGYSLDAQSEALEKYCVRNDIEIVYLFREDHSAKNFDRPAFTTFLDHAKKNKGGIDILLFTSWDRFSRNIMDAYTMIERLKKLGIVPHAIEQPIDLSIPENKAILAMFLVIPEIDNDRRSIKTKGGIRAALKAGRWSRQAPYGYRNTRDENNRPIIVHSVHAQHVKWAFSQIAKRIPQTEVLKELRKRGFKVSRSRLSGMLRLPIYMGKIEVPAYEDEAYQLVEGIHEPIISESLFYQVQEVLNGGVSKCRAPKNSRDEMLPLRGMLKCSECGEKVTGSRSRSHTGTRYAYYHCNHCRSERYRAEQANQVVVDILNGFQFDADSELITGELIKRLLNGKTNEIEAKARSLRNTIKVQSERIARLQDQLADGILSSEDYLEMKTRYYEQQRRAKIKLESLDTDTRGKEELIKRGMKAINALGTHYQKANSKSKALILSSIFPEMIEFDGKKCRTQKINEAIALCLSIDEGFSKNKDKKLHEKLEVSCRVASPGIEPGSKV
jgi:DNA invertase Pin-like site-specific DNA recombinase